MKTIIFILIMVSMLGVFASLIYGLFNMSKEGMDARRKSNKAMWMRVYLQGAAILLLFIFGGLASN